MQRALFRHLRFLATQKGIFFFSAAKPATSLILKVLSTLCFHLLSQKLRALTTQEHMSLFFLQDRTWGYWQSLQPPRQRAHHQLFTDLTRAGSPTTRSHAQNMKGASSQVSTLSQEKKCPQLFP